MKQKKTQKYSQKRQEPDRQESASKLAACSHCHEFVGRNFPACQGCREPVESMIQGAWQALLSAQEVNTGSQRERELVETVLEHSERYWWSEVEAAMCLANCSACGGPLGYGTPGCEECLNRSDMLWGRDLEYAEDGRLTRNEHAMRVALRGLSQAHRHSQFSLDGWRLCLPLWLQSESKAVLTMTREQMQQVQAVGAWIRAGRVKELLHCQSFGEMYAITRQGRK